MIQVYYGDGKGKTTASVGLAVRAAGRNIPVIFSQFLKDDSSGEISVLKHIDHVKVLHPTAFYGFVSRMSEQELQETKLAYNTMLAEVENAILEIKNDKDNIGICVILDEVLHALHYQLVDEDTFIEMLQKYRDRVEFVLTGRNPSDYILQMADYVTEMKKEKHPFDHGVTARIGIEL